MKRKKDRRWMVQTLAAVATNSYIPGFLSKPLSIYKGNLKNVCVPGLNCYSCPGAVGACPVGAMQAVAGGYKHDFSFYIVGILMAFGLFLGRAICGFLCLFGFVQDLLYKIPTPKIKVPKKLDRVLRYLKFAMLILVIVLPMVLVARSIPRKDAPPYELSDPYFCKYVCPAGTLEGGVPLVLLSGGGAQAAPSASPFQALPGFSQAVSAPVYQTGWLFNWKLFLLALTILLSVLIYRPFCKYVCPLGAIYGLLNPVALYRLNIDEAACIHCGKCRRACQMTLDPEKRQNEAECVRCGDCVNACPTGALSMGFTLKTKVIRPAGALTPRP